VAQQFLDEASERSDERRRRAEHRAQVALRRATTARRQAETARQAGNPRGASIHEHEAIVHQRAVEIHQQAAKLQQMHREELETVFAHRGGMDVSGLRLIAENVRLARDEAEVRSQQARSFAVRARARVEKLQTDRRPDRPDA
jgi:hypothetical protein